MTSPHEKNRHTGENDPLSPKEHRIVAVSENIKHDERQDPRHIETDPNGELHAAPGVRFPQEILPSPAAAAHAKEEIDQTPERQEIIADKKIFQIQNAAPRAKGLEPLPEVKPQDAGER